jgi:FAD-linked sulfhydryl oxidase
MQFSPNVWGPFFWHTMHVAALGYPKEPSYTEKKAAKEFYESLQFMLPCGVCREHYAKHIQANPISTFLDRRADLFRWTIMVHNEVNKTLKKPEMSEQEVMGYYSRLGKRDRSPVWTKEDMREVDMQSFLRGLLVGFAGVAIIGGGAWALNKMNVV